MDITTILTYPFFRNALCGILIISIASSIIGTYIVTRRLVAISGGITHSCFGGLGLGYFFGINPLITASIFAVAASLGVELMSTRMKIREDSAIAVVWALGMAVGVIFVFATPGYVPELNSFLFGNILTISSSDLWCFAVYTIMLISFFLWKFEQIVAVAFDRDFARIAGLPVSFVSTMMTVLVAMCIVFTIKLVGIMLLVSIMSLPQLAAEVFTHRFKTIMLLSLLITLAGSMIGIFLSAVVNIPCSALIVSIFVAFYIIARIIRKCLSF